jgi:hypothetical protein
MRRPLLSRSDRDEPAVELDDGRIMDSSVADHSRLRRGDGFERAGEKKRECQQT